MSRKAIAFLSARSESEGIVLEWYKATPFFNDESVLEFSEFSVFRKECVDFEFNNDYQEYFCDLEADDAGLIYRGVLECSNSRKYTFKDREVKTGCTYAYFVRSATMAAVGPVPVKVRDTEVWWSYIELEQQIDRLCKKFPEILKKSVCGKTVEGRDIFSLQVGTGKPFLGLIGAVHPGEAGPELIILALEKYLETAPSELAQRSIAIIPSLNIDMRERLVKGIPWYLRTNAAGVDLNRNFPTDWNIVAKGYGLSSDDQGSMTFRGTCPASEPETQSVINFFKTNTPCCIFSFHALAGICDLPALAAGGVDKSDKTFYAKAKHYAFAYGSGLHSKLKPDESWLTFGGSEGGMARWCWQALGIPGFDLELSSEIAPEALKACRADKTTPALLREYSEKHAGAIKNIMALAD